MGYEISDTKRLDIPEFPDLEVVVKVATTFAEFNRFRNLATLNADNGEELDKGFHTFGDTFLKAWNVTSGGEDLEPNGDNFSRLPPLLKVAILQAWAGTVGVASGPLDNASSTSSGSPEPSTNEPASG